MADRRFPPPWSIEEANNACFIVRDKTGQALGYFYFEEEPGRRFAAKLLTPSPATVEKAASATALRFRCSASRHLGEHVLAPDRCGRNHRLQFLHWTGRLSSTGLRIC